MSNRSHLRRLQAVVILAGLAMPLSLTAQDILLEGHVDVARVFPNVTIADTSSGSAFLIATRPTASFFGTFSNSNFGIRVNNTDLMRFTTALRVGIGTASPISKLHVLGDIRVQNGSFIDDGTNLNVPDYVFEDGYNLMPIDQLARFIATENHLPNVPTEEEVHRNGVDLGAFQMRLLEKIEELTLYTLQQQEQIDQLLAERDAGASLEKDSR